MNFIHRFTVNRRQLPQHGLLEVMLFFAIYPLIVIGFGVRGTEDKLLLAELTILLGIFLGSHLLANKRQDINIWDFCCFVSGYVLLNVIIYSTGGYSSMYHFLYLIPAGIYSLSGKKSLGMASVHLNSAALVTFTLLHTVSSKLMIDDHFFYVTGIIIIMYLEFRLIRILYEKTEQQIEEAETLARYDEQTQLLRYREFELCLNGKMAEWKENKKPFSLLVIDLDDFNYYNSKYGYTMGNKIIANMAAALRSNLNFTDKAFSFPGVRFAVLTHMAKEEIDDFINHMQTDAVRLAGTLNVKKLTISTGYACFPKDASNGEDLLEQAMWHLEEAKENLQREQLEQQKRAEKMALVGQLAAGLAHELRNPLTSAKGFCQLAKENAEGSLVKTYLKYADEDLDRLISLIGDFLLLTKPGAPQLEPLDVTVLLQEIIDFLESQARLHDISVVMQIPSYFPHINGDKEQLRQAIINVMVNAFEAMSENGRLNIRLYSTVDKVAIAFEDNGKGITEQDLTHILNPFFTTKEEGTGLGLAITQRIITGHGGDIVVRSQEGEGTVVTLYLPVVADNVQSETG